MRERIKEKGKRIKLAFLLILFSFCFFSLGFAQDDDLIPVIKFKDADIRVVLQSIAQKATRDGEKVNIVISPSVEGLVSVSLENVDWFSTLEAVLRPYDYSYEWIGETILLVDTTEKISAREALAKEREEVEPSRTKVFKLKFIDANDAKKAIECMLSPIGRVSVLEVTGQAGWEFGSDVTKRSRSKEGKASRTKTLIVSDISKKLDEVDSLLKKIDIMPKQIMIKTRIMEVNRDTLEDFGFDWGTGLTGATSATYVDSGDNQGLAQMRAVTPSIFGPLEGTAFTPVTAGLQLGFKKITGTDFQAILHALEEDARTNTLSAPVILTLDNQEASILVGTKYPIIQTEVSTETSLVTGGSLEYYQDIGIQVNVVPQICGENDGFINMIIHPAVTSTSSNVEIKASTGDVAIATYPIITSREIETQVVIKDGETIVIGGLFKDVKSEQEIGVPILRRIPVLGWLFKRRTEDVEKIDLMIFITAKIVKPDDIIPLEIMDTGKFTALFEEME